MIVKDGQNIFDLCLQGYGSLSYLFDVIDDNNLDLDSQMFSGQDITIDASKGDEDIKSYIVRNPIVFNNGQGSNDPPILGGDYNSDYNSDYS